MQVCSILKIHIYLQLLCVFWDIETILNSTYSTGLNASRHLFVDLTTAICRHNSFLLAVVILLSQINMAASLSHKYVSEKPMRKIVPV
jgi:hypothetical protein